ncbi:unnamed protein product, partial [Candidula unifasciata]
MAVCRQVTPARRLNLQACLHLCVMLLATSSGVHGFFGEWGPDLEGPWCATRRGQDCCDGRDDNCGVPILGTECYCDLFCNHTAYDCCPDYWRHCHGQPVPATTPRPTTLPPPRTTRDTLGMMYHVSGFPWTYRKRPSRRSSPISSINDSLSSITSLLDGVSFRPGETIRDNCNNCTCELYGLPNRRYEWRCTQNVCLLRPELIQAVNGDLNY